MVLLRHQFPGVLSLLQSLALLVYFIENKHNKHVGSALFSVKMSFHCRIRYFSFILQPPDTLSFFLLYDYFTDYANYFQAHSTRRIPSLKASTSTKSLIENLLISELRRMQTQLPNGIKAQAPSKL